MLCRSRYCYGKLSVCLSVSLKYPDHIGWNTLKIISPLVSLGVLSPQTPTSQIYSKGNTRNFGRNMGGFSKKRLLAYKWQSLKRSNTGPRLLLRSNRKSYTCFRHWLTLKGHYAPCFKTRAPWCCYLFLVLHSVCFQATNDWQCYNGLDLS